ncbi:hypothetical protein [Ligilactobacillus saerimneri]|uniref:hypothetical protein n=1 Tax=Ligilactobacillus saerimneri TaxID=228229 RepID=UPI001C11F0A8|nr:hypothetical protein [Ligilactobacillus saerimneri]MBU5310301.1 hypothetical protein [Ligilactobacillus saerimneri]
MRKSKLLIVLLSGLLLAGCGKSTDTKHDTQTTATSKTEKKASTEQKQASSSTSQTSSSEATSSSAATTDEDSKRLVDLGQQLKQKLGANEKFPTAHLINGVENARYSGDQNNYTVDFYGHNRGVALNDSRLNDSQPFLTLSKKTYGSRTEATATVKYSDGKAEVKLPHVDLGYNIVGTVNSGAGQRYLHWNEGRWSLGVRGSAVAGQDPKKTARKVVALTQAYALPVPETRGAGTFEVDNSGTISWVKGNAVYTLKSKNYQALIVSAASLK